GVSRTETFARRRADQLVERIVSADVLSHRLQLSGAVGPPGGVGGASQPPQRGQGSQLGERRLHRFAANPKAVRERAERPDGVFQALHAAEAATGSALQVA